MYSFLNPTHHTFFSALANVPHPLSSLEGLVPSLIAGYQFRVDHPTFEVFAEIKVALETFPISWGSLTSKFHLAILLFLFQYLTPL